MKELENYITNYNIVSTKMVEKMDNSINIYNLINNYNSKFNLLKADYDNLTKLNLTDHTDLDYYCESMFFDFKMIKLFIYNNKDTQDKHIILLQNEDKTMVSTNQNNSISSNIMYISDKTINEYIQFGKKNCNIISLYRNLKKGYYYKSDNMLIKIQYHGNILEDNNYITVSIGHEDIDFILTFKLGEKLKLQDIKIINQKYKNINTDEINNMVNTLYINKDYLPKTNNESKKYKRKRS